MVMIPEQGAKEIFLGLLLRSSVNSSSFYSLFISDPLIIFPLQHLQMLISPS